MERRRSLYPLHRRHDRDAEGRHVAQRRCDGRVLRRIEDGDHDRRVPRRGQHRPAGAARSAVHARRRPLDEPSDVARRWDRVHPVHSGTARTVRHLGPCREGAVELPAHRRRRVRPSTARRAGATALRAVEPHRAPVGRRTAVGEPQGRVPSPFADADDRRRTRVVGGGRPDVARVHWRRGDDGHVRDHARQPRAERRARP